MGTASRIRGQEATVQIVVDGDLKRSSFSKVASFTITPKEDNAETSFLGETEDDFDFMHRGYEFSMTLHEITDDVNRVLAKIVANERQHLPHPDITVILIERYRDVAGTQSNLTMEQCRIKLDSKAIGSAKDYVVNTISGKCRIMTVS